MNHNLGGQNSRVPAGDSQLFGGLGSPDGFDPGLLLNDDQHVTLDGVFHTIEPVPMEEPPANVETQGRNLRSRQSRGRQRGRILSQTLAAIRSRKSRAKQKATKKQTESTIGSLTQRNAELTGCNDVLRANQDELQRKNDALNREVDQLTRTVEILNEINADTNSQVALLQEKLLNGQMEPGSPENRIAALQKENENLVDENKELRDENELLSQLVHKYTNKRKQRA